ncbi:MAG: hypothetical protein M1813_001730 [Trichoglossum hirsutum]|nr:MAG: hypothetical protein M1813_001730 [Trichoglossum hirsutum]
MSGSTAVIKKKAVREPSFHTGVGLDLSPDPAWKAMYDEEMRKRGQGQPAKEEPKDQVAAGGEESGKEKKEKKKQKGKKKGKKKERQKKRAENYGIPRLGKICVWY